ncbi:MAG: FtsQ-type POTRA domain-containing protein [Verrucomicrobiaceae bacterium]|nr:FtsQ-type POTRA domain-containing protein [Verrucomicrobiaceae bacterium]
MKKATDSSAIRKPRKDNLKRGGKKHRPDPDAQRHEIDLDPITPKMREDEEAASRRKGFRLAVALVIAVVLGALMYVSVKETVISNPAFELKYVFVKTEGMLTKLDVAKASGLKPGDNLMTADLSHVKANVMSLHGVKSATVTRDFSGRLDITVTQHNPVSWVRCENLGWVPKKPGAGLLVSDLGVAVPCVNMLQEYSDFPEIQDETLAEVAAGGLIANDRFQAALKLLQSLTKREKTSGESVSVIKVVNDCTLQVKMKSGLAASFAWDDLDAGLARFDIVIAEAKRQKWSLTSLNLMAENVVPVTFKAVPKVSGDAPAAVPLVQPARRSATGQQRRKSTR